MSFTNYYFEYGFNSTMEKMAKEKPVKAAMRVQQKSGNITTADKDGKTEQWPKTTNILAGLGGAAALAGLGYAGHEGLLGDTAQDVIQDGVGAAKNAIYNAPAMASQAKEAIINAGKDAGEFASNKSQDVANYIKNLMGNPAPGSPQSFELENIMKAFNNRPEIPFK